MKFLQNGDLDISSIVNRIHSENPSPWEEQQKFESWVRKEQAKVNDPKARSYSIFAQLVCLD